MKFRKKPVVIEAMQITDATFDAPHPNHEHIPGVVYDEREQCVFIDTLEGRMRGDLGDWIIRGVKGEFYPCKPDIFAATYERVEPPTDTEYAFGMDLAGALAFMRDGHKVQRAGWNGKGMFIVLMPALKLPPYSSQSPGAKVNDRTAKHIGIDTPLDSQPYIALWTADGKWQPGWNASTPDLLATDWQVVFPNTDA